MAKVIFLFPNLKIVNTSLEDLELTEKFLTGKEVDNLGYDLQEMSEAYSRINKNYKFV